MDKFEFTKDDYYIRLRERRLIGFDNFIDRTAVIMEEDAAKIFYLFSDGRFFYYELYSGDDIYWEIELPIDVALKHNIVSKQEYDAYADYIVHEKKIKQLRRNSEVIQDMKHRVRDLVIRTESI